MTRSRRPRAPAASATGAASIAELCEVINETAQEASFEDAARVALGGLSPLAAADAAALWCVEPGGSLRCVATWRTSEVLEGYERWCRTPGAVAPTGPVTMMLQEPQPLDRTGDGGADTERAQVLTACGVERSIAAPLRCGRTSHGVLELVSTQPHAPAGCREGVAIVAALLGHRAALHAAHEAERGGEQQALLDASLDAFVAIDRDGLVTTFSPSAERMFGWSRQEAVGQPVAELIVPPPFRPFHEEGIARYRETGEGRLIGQRSRLSALRRDGTQFPVELTVVAAKLADGSEFAAFIRDASDEMDIEQALVASGQRFAEQVRALQRSFLPAAIPEIEEVDLAVRYTPAADDVEVGGDFYDIFAVPGGGLGIAIGDVEGKGIHAASLMGLSRLTIRALGTSQPGLLHVAQGLNQALLADADTRLCSLAYGLLSTGRRGVTITFVLAGHPRPLHVRRGRARGVGRPGRILGVEHPVLVTAEEVKLRPGDVLVLYTDGLTEARNADGEFLGEARVRDELARSHGLDAEGIAERLEQLALTFQSRGARDDIALVVVRVPPRGDR